MNSLTHRRESQKKRPNLILYIFSLIFYKKTYLDSCLWFILFWESPVSSLQLWSPTSVQCCQISIMSDCLLNSTTTCIFWNIFCSTLFSTYKKVFVVFLLMQELFVDKIHFFKFLFMSDKPWLDQLKVITATGIVVKQASLNFSTGKRKGKYPLLSTNMKPQQLVKHTKISYLIATLYSANFRTSPTEMV